MSFSFILKGSVQIRVCCDLERSGGANKPPECFIGSLVPINKLIRNQMKPIISIHTTEQPKLILLVFTCHMALYLLHLREDISILWIRVYRNENP